MTDFAHSARSASMRRMVIGAIGGFIGLLLVGATALWLTLGTAVFFEVIAAGIAYCF